ncbi:MAG TPA: helix-turn-helix domain-containing protein [Bacillota bacterium]
MTGLLMVEDEERIQQKLLENVSWKEFGFDPVLGAGNGLEALDLLRDYSIDIIVTDIQMPKMNGIELIKALKADGYQGKIVVISGFAEFEYAQESIKLNVADYLLKPFTSKKLLETVTRLKNQLEQERAEKSELLLLREQLHKNREVLREKFFSNLLNHNWNRSTSGDELNFLGLGDLESKPCQVAVVEIPENLLHQTEEEKYLINLMLLTQMKRIFADSGYNHFLVNQLRNQVAAIFYEPDQNLGLRLEEFLNQLQLSLKQPLVIGVGNTYHSLGDLSASYREACMALQYRYLHGPNRVFSIRDLNLDNPFYHKQFYYLHQNRIFDDLRIGAAGAIRDDVAAFIGILKNSSMPPESLRTLASNLILLTYATLNELGYHPVEIFGSAFSPLTDVNRTESLGELEEFLLMFFDRINRYTERKRTSLNQTLVDEIRCQIDNQYAAEITLSGMADRYKISPGYLSLLFTERTGKNFIDYLTERRIKRAKELLKHTAMKIYEIAAEVGYNDSYYFSNCFKKVVGLTPTEYREHMEGGEAYPP